MANAQLNIYQEAGGDTKVLFKGYTAKGKQETGRPLIPFAEAERRLLSTGYSLIDSVSFPITFEEDEDYDSGDVIVNNGDLYEVIEPFKSTESLDQDILKGKVKSIGTKTQGLSANDKARYDAYDGEIKAVKEKNDVLNALSKGVELVGITTGEEVTNNTTDYVSAISTSFIADKSADYWFAIYMEVECDTLNKIIDFQVKSGETILSETYTKLEVVNSKKVIIIETSKIPTEAEYPVLVDAFFKLHTNGGIAKITHSRITAYRQRSV